MKKTNLYVCAILKLRLVHGLLDGPLEAQEPLLALPRRAGHNLPTQLRIMIPGPGGQDRPTLDPQEGRCDMTP
jgi:hypothetical protein